MRSARWAVISMLASVALVAPMGAAVGSPGWSEPAGIATRAASSASSLAAPSADMPPAVSNLPSIFIELTDPDPTHNTLEYIHASKNNEAPGTLDLVDDANPANNLTGAVLTQFKGRGNWTWTLDKRPYQIKFDTSTGPLGMASAKTWVLLANHADTSLLRNKVAYDLAAAIGLAYSPETRPVDLVVNGEHLGSYLLSEKTEVKKNRVELASDSGVLLELDNNYGTAEDYHFYTSTSNTLFVLKDAKLGVDVPLDPTVAAAYEEIKAHVNSLDEAVSASDPDWNRIQELIDVDSFLRFYFVQELVENPDVTQSSVYFYKDGPSDKLHAGPVWDFDIALANFTPETMGGDARSDYVKNADILRAKGNGWFRQLFRNEEFAAAANALYASEIKPAIDALPTRIDEYASAAEQSANLNFERWPILGEPNILGVRGHVVADTWLEEVAYLRNWVAARGDFLDSAYAQNLPIVRTTAHLSNLGWLPTVSGGQMAGVPGKTQRVEALRLSTTGPSLGGTIQGNAHIQKIGWTGWKPQGGLIGTTGKALRMEAVQLRLTGTASVNYELEYRAYVTGQGWLPWVRNGATAGTVGKAGSLDAVQVRLIERDSPRSAPLLTPPAATYRSYLQKRSWGPYVLDNQVSGAPGSGLRIEALQLNVTGAPVAGGVEYRAYVQSLGWMPWTKGPSKIGTTGKGLRLEAFQIRLTGELAARYSVRYRSYVQGLGWQRYYGNGQTSGTVAKGKRVEGVRILLLPR